MTDIVDAAAERAEMRDIIGNRPLTESQVMADVMIRIFNSFDRRATTNPATKPELFKDEE